MRKTVNPERPSSEFRQSIVLAVKATAAAIAIAAAVAVGVARAEDAPTANPVSPLLQAQLQLKYPEGRVEMTDVLHFSRGTGSAVHPQIRILTETARGEVQFAVLGETPEEYSEGWTSFAAWADGQVAVRRIHPGEALTADLFRKMKINVALGAARESRGILFGTAQGEIKGLQSRQTILEGQLLTTSAVEKTPDIRRGDVIQVHLHTGVLELSTAGVAEEPGYLNRTVRVTASKTKRELVGLLRPDGIVEVNL